MKQLFATLTALYFCAFSFAQDKPVTVIGDGDGANKTIATNQALRNCIEKSMGAFLSSSTTVINDSLAKDEIVTIASGNIVSYEVLSEVSTNNNYSVSVSALISPEKLVQVLNSKGYSFELNGGVYAQNILKEKFYTTQERPALENFIATWEKIPLFDFEVALLEPKVISGYCKRDFSPKLNNVDNLQMTEVGNKYIEQNKNVLDWYRINSIAVAKGIKEKYDVNIGGVKNLRQSLGNNGGQENWHNGLTDGYVIFAVITPKFRQEYISFVKALLNLLSSISIKDLANYNALNKGSQQIFIPADAIAGGVDISKYPQFTQPLNNRQERECVVFSLRSNKNLDLFEKLSKMVNVKSSGLNISSALFNNLKTVPQVFGDSYPFINTDYSFHIPPDIMIYPFYATAGPQSLQFSADQIISSKIMAIYLTLDELQALKKLEFSSTDGSGIITPGEKKGLMGVKIVDIDAALIEQINQKKDSKSKYLKNDTKGIYINEVIEGSAAYEAGIRNGDIITKLNGEDDLTTAIHFEKFKKFHSGDEISLTVQQWQGGEKTFKVKLK
ncbi:MAG: PDZ domain-containing protein [Bacteroidetes bacterium]|nr:PDZ domain-containing protein [Bacteroidota bacterium]